MRLAVPKETRPGERRVALVPGDLARLAGVGIEVVVERGAGEAALYTDKDYESAGASVAPGAKELYVGADLVVKVQPPTLAEVDIFPSGISVLSFLAPASY